MRDIFIIDYSNRFHILMRHFLSQPLSFKRANFAPSIENSGDGRDISFRIEIRMPSLHENDPYVDSC